MSQLIIVVGGLLFGLASLALPVVICTAVYDLYRKRPRLVFWWTPALWLLGGVLLILGWISGGSAVQPL